MEKDLESLEAIEARHPGGLTSAEVVKVLEAQGVHFSEASLRKYVQWELLPRSTRVAHRGAQGGSQGQYPVTVVRRILEIKALMGQGYSIEDIRAGGLSFGREIDELQQHIQKVMAVAERAVHKVEDSWTHEAAVRDHRRAQGHADDLLTSLRGVLRHLTEATPASVAAG